MRVRWARLAEEDLAALVQYIATDSVAAALQMDDLVTGAAESLDRMPRRGRPGAVPGTRELVVVGTPYVIIYEVEAEDVWILRVRHGAQDWPADWTPGQ